MNALMGQVCYGANVEMKDYMQLNLSHKASIVVAIQNVTLTVPQLNALMENSKALMILVMILAQLPNLPAPLLCQLTTALMKSNVLMEKISILISTMFAVRLYQQI